MSEFIKAWGVIAFILIAFFGLFTALFLVSNQPQFQEPKPPAAAAVIESFSAESLSAGKQGKIFISVSFPKEIDSINYFGEGNELKQSIECGKQKSCSVEFNAFFSSSGTKEISFSVVSGENSFRLKEFVKVFSGKKICLDGTEFGKCSSSGEYCGNGKLEKNCIECGCALGFECVSNDCVLVAPQISLAGIESPKVIGIGLNALIDLSIQSAALIPSGASFSANLVEGSRIISSAQFSLEESLEKGEEKIAVSFPLDENSIASGIHSISLELFFSGKKISSFDLGEINFIEKSGAKPSAPFMLQASVYGNAVDLSWSASDERTAFFRVYESKTVSSMFVSYSLAGETEANSFSFDLLSNGTHYFVVKAVDAFGLESDYSEQAMVEIS